MLWDLRHVVGYSINLGASKFRSPVFDHLLCAPAFAHCLLVGFLVDFLLFVSTPFPSSLLGWLVASWISSRGSMSILGIWSPVLLGHFVISITSFSVKLFGQGSGGGCVLRSHLAHGRFPF